MSEDEWAELEASGKTLSAFFRDLMRLPTAPEPVKEKVAYERRHAEERWQIYLRTTEQQPSPEVIEKAKDATFRLLFPDGENVAKVETKTQYICPFTGKRFGSMDALVRAAIPHLIKSAEADQRWKNASEQPRSPQYFDQIR
ncbi:hypothetical protein [Gordoniibacillus kamchatkensis]|uniref:hypothetical protein n=1 Tax=Gordoniibacillus kamchatkensis TaxID=1590651 RepID=UPI0018CF91FE|nr:hypothetical protein [Paenibacillus sp. VKM B-2647]